jgi:hypothetical protein
MTLHADLSLFIFAAVSAVIPYRRNAGCTLEALVGGLSMLVLATDASAGPFKTARGASGSFRCALSAECVVTIRSLTFGGSIAARSLKNGCA